MPRVRNRDLGSLIPAREGGPSCVMVAHGLGRPAPQSENHRLFHKQKINFLARRKGVNVERSLVGFSHKSRPSLKVNKNEKQKRGIIRNY